MNRGQDVAQHHQVPGGCQHGQGYICAPARVKQKKDGEWWGNRVRDEEQQQEREVEGEWAGDGVREKLTKKEKNKAAAERKCQTSWSSKKPSRMHGRFFSRDSAGVS